MPLKRGDKGVLNLVSTTIRARAEGSGEVPARVRPKEAFGRTGLASKDRDDRGDVLVDKLGHAGRRIEGQSPSAA